MLDVDSYVTSYYITNMSRCWNGLRAKAIQEAEGRSNKWLADRCGISHGSLRNAFAGQYDPSDKVIELMAEALGVEVEELVDPSEDEAIA